MLSKIPSFLELLKLHSAEDLELQKYFSRQFNLHPALAQILVLRGFREKKDAEQFLFGDLHQLPNPFDISGVEEAAQRVLLAVQNKEKILLFGDYDVDGITGTAQLALFLKEIGGQVEAFLPHRLHDGYGLSESVALKIASKKPKLLITIDNGTKSKEAISFLKEQGIETIVIDHHETPHPDHFPPVVALINPKSPDQNFPERNLASAGLVFLFLMALRSKLRERNAPLPNLKRYLDLACLGTIADVVPLTGTNRLIVKFGLQELTQSQRPGIKALKEVAAVQEAVTPYIVGFRLAPRINAAGRMADPTDALNLLMAATESEAYPWAQKLEDYNRRRQLEEESALKEAFEMVEHPDTGQLGRRGIVVASKDWHLGVVGILAARLTEKYNRPAIALTLLEEKMEAKGSARSVPGFSVYAALKDIEGKMKKFGGHEAAAGMTLNSHQLEDFALSFHHSISKIAPEPFQRKIKIDGELGFSEISPELMKQLELFGPFGAGNPEPCFKSEKISLHSCRIVGNKHLKFSAKQESFSFEGIGFNEASYLEQALKYPFHQLIYNLQNNTWNGQTTIQLKAKTLNCD